MKRWTRRIAIILLFCMLANLSTFPVSAKYFSDIYPGMLDREFFDAFNYVSDNGYIAGTDSSHFSPYVSISRAMFVAILYRYSGSTASYPNNFTDVPANAYYYDAVGWAVHYGIVAGTSTTTFSPDATITKEQMAAFLYRYATNFDGKTYTPSTFDSIAAHPDYSYVSSYAIEAIRWAKTYRVFQLVNDSDYISPTANMNRAYAALHLANYAKNVTGFVAGKDWFSFTNDSGSFGTTCTLANNFAEHLYDTIYDYYGANVEKAETTCENISTKIGASFNGSCFGIAICTLFDKLGKIDFNENFGSGANSLYLVGKPKDNPNTVASAINYYQLMQSIQDITYRRRRYSGNLIMSGASYMYNYFQDYGPTLMSYGYEENGVFHGHMVVLTGMTYNASDNKYTVTMIDSNQMPLKTSNLYLKDGTVYLGFKALTELIYWPTDALHFLDNFDLDGTYNDEDHSTSTYSTDFVTPTKNSDSKETSNTTSVPSASMQTATLNLPYSYFRITNASGETLVYDEEGLHGNMKVLAEYTIPNGPDFPADLTLTVNASDYFVYENLLGGYTSFGVHGLDSFGNVNGNGLHTITVNMQNKSIYVDGENIDYRAWLKIGVNNYEYFYLEGESSGAFSINKTEQGVATQGVNGLQKGGFADAKTMRPKTLELSFTNSDSFDLSHIAEDDTILFSNQGVSQAETAITTFTFGGD